jgi:hypothetical protein
LHGITVDYLTIEPSSQVDGELPKAISTGGLRSAMKPPTLDLPVPVAPMTTIRGSFGFFEAMLKKRLMHTDIYHCLFECYYCSPGNFESAIG